MNRRQLLLRGALLAALAPVVRAADPAMAGGGVAGTRWLAVYDPAYRRSREFALGLQQRGAGLLALEPDALAAWHHGLREHIAAAPGLRIAGLTTRTDCLVLHDLARGAGYRSLARSDADAAHAISGIARHRATLLAWVLAPA